MVFETLDEILVDGPSIVNLDDKPTIVDDSKIQRDHYIDISAEGTFLVKRTIKLCYEHMKKKDLEDKVNHLQSLGVLITVGETLKQLEENDDCRILRSREIAKEKTPVVINDELKLFFDEKCMEKDNLVVYAKKNGEVGLVNPFYYLSINNSEIELVNKYLKNMENYPNANKLLNELPKDEKRKIYDLLTTIGERTKLTYGFESDDFLLFKNLVPILNELQVPALIGCGTTGNESEDMVYGFIDRLSNYKLDELFTNEDILNLSRLLFSVNPPERYNSNGDHEWDNYMELPNIRTITDETSSLIVGEISGRVFKIYQDENIVKKEAFLLKQFENHPLLSGRVQKLSLALRGKDLEEKLKKHNFSESKTSEIVSTAEFGYLSFNGTYLLISESEISLKNDSRSAVLNPRTKHVNETQEGRFEGKLIRWEEKQSQKHYLDIVTKLTKEIQKQGLKSELLSIANDKMVNRMYTLACLHGKSMSHIDNDLVKAEYVDFVPLELKLEKNNTNEHFKLFTTHDQQPSLKSKLLKAYLNANKRQSELYERRKAENKLVLTHGDAKWDNWFGDVLGDFGSAKFSTEYKDVAKSLLDSAHHKYSSLEKDYLTFLENSQIGENQIQFMKKTDISKLVENGKLSTELGTIMQKWKDEEITFGQFKSEYASLIRESIPEVPVTAVIDDYIAVYVKMRELTGSPVEESLESFTHNVYDALITESVRTIYYKFPQTEKKSVVDHLTIVAEHYVDVINN